MIRIFKIAAIFVLSYLNYKSLEGSIVHPFDKLYLVFGLLVPIQLLFHSTKSTNKTNEVDHILLFFYVALMVSTGIILSKQINFSIWSPEQTNIVAFPYVWLMIIVSQRTAYKSLNASELY
jgi:hypothetical protein